jgi:hypothetical protein
MTVTVVTTREDSCRPCPAASNQNKQDIGKRKSRMQGFPLQNPAGIDSRKGSRRVAPSPEYDSIDIVAICQEALEMTR